MTDPGAQESGTLSRHILPSCGTMIGICTTLVGLVKILEGRTGETAVDEVGGAVALVFMLSAVLSYLSIRHTRRRPTLSRRLERMADTVFFLGLLGIGGLTLLFAYDQL